MLKAEGREDHLVFFIYFNVIIIIIISLQSMLETFAALHRALTQIREHQKSVTLVGIGGYSALPVLRKGWYCYAFIN